MPISEELLAVLACVESKKPLVYVPAHGEEPEWLFCPESKLRYRFDPVGGFPVLLVDEAARVSDSEAEALMARARA